MKIHSKLYPEIEKHLGDKVIQFYRGYAEVDDKTGRDLILESQFEIAQEKGFVSSDNLMGFKSTNWSKDRKLNFATPLSYKNGYGKAGMYIASALTKICDCYVMNNGWNNGREFVLPEVMKAMDKEGSDLDSWYIEFAPVHMTNKRAKRQIIWSMLEANRIPKSWVDKWNNSCERGIVPCEAQKQAFLDSGCNTDIAVIPLGIPCELYPYNKQARERILTDEEFVFGMEGTLTFRKGVDLAIHAFQMAFADKAKYSKVALMLKSSEDAAAYYYDEIKNDSRMFFNSNWLTPDELITEFYDKLDCYVFPSRGEGYGMTTCQAMAQGIPTIGTDCSGIQDHLNNEVGWLVPTKVVPVPNGCVYNNGKVEKAKNDNEYLLRGIGYPVALQAVDQMWWECEVEDLAKAMLEVYENRKLAFSKGKKASKHIKDNFDMPIIAQKVVEYLDKKV